MAENGGMASTDMELAVFVAWLCFHIGFVSAEQREMGFFSHACMQERHFD